MNNFKINRMANVLALAAAILTVSGCESTNSDTSTIIIPIGANFEVTGSLPDVGRQAVNATAMFVEEMNKNAGIESDGNRYLYAVILKDNGTVAEDAVAATQSLIKEEQVLAIVGPNPSFLAIPAGEAANALETVMISPWSTNPQTTMNRPWVFRAAYLDAFQGKVLAGFAKTQYNAVNACLLYAADSPYPKGLAESFMAEWLNLEGTIVASETFQTGDQDLTPQLTAIREAQCDFLFLPQYANEVPAILKQAHELGITIPVLGCDGWASQALIDNCGDDCEGYFMTKQFVAAGATGMAFDFVERYEAKYNATPGDVAALTYDAFYLVDKAISTCGVITGNLETDRACIRDAMAAIHQFEGVTGTITFDENGNPLKCISIIKIENGEFTFFDTICPDMGEV